MQRIAVRKLVRLPNGRVGVIFVDAATGRQVTDLSGYSLYSAGGENYWGDTGVSPTTTDTSGAAISYDDQPPWVDSRDGGYESSFLDVGDVPGSDYRGPDLFGLGDRWGVPIDAWLDENFAPRAQPVVDFIENRIASPITRRLGREPRAEVERRNFEDTQYMEVMTSEEQRQRDAWEAYQGGRRARKEAMDAARSVASPESRMAQGQANRADAVSRSQEAASPTSGVPTTLGGFAEYRESYGPKRPDAPNQDIVDGIRAAVEQVVPGGTVVGISGKGPYGSARHRGGHALDFDVYDADGNRVTDPRTHVSIAAAATAHGITGWGIGNEYMGAGRAHMDNYPVDQYTWDMDQAWGSIGNANQARMEMWTEMQAMVEDGRMPTPPERPTVMSAMELTTRARDVNPNYSPAPDVMAQISLTDINNAANQLTTASPVPSQTIEDAMAGAMGVGRNVSNPFGFLDNMSAPTPTMEARLTTDIARETGVPDHVAAAMTGNMAHETGNWRSMQEVNPVMGGRGGLGFAQWTGPRRTDFEDYLREEELSPASYEANLGFFLDELENNNWANRQFEKARQTPSVDAATLTLQDNYFRPSARHAHTDRRLDNARRVFDDYNQYMDEREAFSRGLQSQVDARTTSRSSVQDPTRVSRQRAFDLSTFGTFADPISMDFETFGTIPSYDQDLTPSFDSSWGNTNISASLPFDNDPNARASTRRDTAVSPTTTGTRDTGKADWSSFSNKSVDDSAKNSPSPSRSSAFGGDGTSSGDSPDAGGKKSSPSGSKNEAGTGTSASDSFSGGLGSKSGGSNKSTSSGGGFDSGYGDGSKNSSSSASSGKSTSSKGSQDGGKNSSSDNDDNDNGLGGWDGWI